VSASSHSPVIVGMPGGWHADCGCGWNGPSREEIASAHTDFVIHLGGLDEIETDQAESQPASHSDDVLDDSLGGEQS
jgi:hypothetical protein